MSANEMPGKTPVTGWRIRAEAVQINLPSLKFAFIRVIRGKSVA
jgi:hypothetical protein